MPPATPVPAATSTFAADSGGNTPDTAQAASPSRGANREAGTVTSPCAAIILAAGRGSRMNSRRPTALHALSGQPLAAHVVDLIRTAGCGTIVIVVGEQGEQVQEALGPDHHYAVQDAPTGSLTAALAGLHAMADIEGPVLVVPTGAALIAAETVRFLLEQHLRTGKPTALLPETGEEPAACLLDVRTLHALCDLEPQADTLIGALQASGAVPGFYGTEDPAESLVVRTRVDLATAATAVRARILRQHLLAGVTIEDPASTYVEHGVTIGQDTVLRPLTFLERGTVIGEECEIGPNVRISQCTVGNRVAIQNAVLAESTVGDDTRIGPFAQLRPGSSVGRKVKIGNFVELKKATVEDRVSLGHFAYMGDVFVGEKTNIGAGTITCNYDGKHKHVTRIGRNSFIGSNATLVAPVEIGEGAFVAAASVVTEEVPADALALGRARQVNKPEWAKKRRERE